MTNHYSREFDPMPLARHVIAPALVRRWRWSNRQWQRLQGTLWMGATELEMTEEVQTLLLRHMGTILRREQGSMTAERYGRARQILDAHRVTSVVQALREVLAVPQTSGSR